MPFPPWMCSSSCEWFLNCNTININSNKPEPPDPPLRLRPDMLNPPFLGIGFIVVYSSASVSKLTTLSALQEFPPKVPLHKNNNTTKIIIIHQQLLPPKPPLPNPPQQQSRLLQCLWWWRLLVQQQSSLQQLLNPWPPHPQMNKSAIIIIQIRKLLFFSLLLPSNPTPFKLWNKLSKSNFLPPLR